MRRKRNLHKDNRSVIIRLDECKYIGGSFNSSVYLMKDNKVVKIYKDPIQCRKEYNLLKEPSVCIFFPKIYNFCGHYIIREYIDGVSIVKFINEGEFHGEMAVTLIKFLEKLYINNILHLNIKLEDIFIRKNNNIILLDIVNSDLQKNSLNKIFQSLKDLHVLELFLNELKIYNSVLYNVWTKQLHLGTFK